MVKLNHHFQKLQTHYLFHEISKRVAANKSKQPLIHLGIGDITHPLSPTIVSALTAAAQEMGEKRTLRGYGPSNGYSFLREAIAQNDYKKLGISPDEIFISDGAKSDLGNIQEIFATDNRIALPDPTYPVYLETNVMAGRTRLPLKTGRYGGITYLACAEENGFIPEIPNSHVDLVYLCSPNNPTGVAMSHQQLKKWVEYAKKNQAVILFDGAYEAYISSDAPRSIYEIEGAKEVAVEIRSFSKTAGFTGLRCAYTVIPKELKIVDAGRTHLLSSLWERRLESKSNGVSYPVQKAAAATFTPSGQKEIRETIKTYMERANFLRNGLKKIGFTVYGGTDAPYLWCKTPPKVSSWEFFDFLLEKAGLVTVPGSGFGQMGEGFLRLSAFAEMQALCDSLDRIKKL